MKKTILNIFGQQNISKRLGMFFLTVTQVGMVVSLLILLETSVNAYVEISTWLMGYGIYIRFWIFMSVIISVLIITYILAWKFLLPSYLSSWNEQFYKHDNLVQKDLEEIKRQMSDGFDNIKNRLDKLKL
ncbi:hypothetical protein MUP46_00950 [Patescibacteria group bacterium]|nr:hypothetical protein [Patescibacteria group bacterium]